MSCGRALYRPSNWHFLQHTTASPWRNHLLRSISESYTDSPSSSSSFLSSNTCSPWETCPGLAPASPAMPMFDDLTAQYSGSLHFDSAGETPATAFNTLSLGSPLRSPIMLPHYPEVIEPYNLFATPDASPDFSSNALALDFSADTTLHAGPAHTQESLLFTPYGNDTLTPQKAKSMSSLSVLPETSSSMGVPSFTGGSMDGGFPSESSLFARSTRRKTSRIDYAEQGYEGDSDDEYEQDANAGVSKRRKARTASAAFPGESDDEASEDSAGRGRKPRGPGRGKGGAAAGAGAAAKRKAKRRHHCTRDGCTSSFTRVTDMERHVASVHRHGDTDANRCSFCRKVFSREDAVLRHENDSCPMRPKKKAAERWT